MFGFPTYLVLIRLADDYRAVRDYRNSLHREVPAEFLPLLPKFTEPQYDIPKDEIHQQMLFYLFVFEYMNEHQWYEVNPVLRELIPVTGE